RTGLVRLPYPEQSIKPTLPICLVTYLLTTCFAFVLFLLFSLSLTLSLSLFPSCSLVLFLDSK
ncbi:hypothetical protein BO99DRAFT_484845, partial [Aspergillus violaceofuscus CBS 115571]